MPTKVALQATFLDPATGWSIDAVTQSGFGISFDTANAGDARRGPSPTEVVLAALAGCTAMDVASILRKKRQRVVDYRIAVSAEKADEDPTVFLSIVVEHQVVGDVEAEAVRRAVELSATRYCPVSAMLSASVKIEHRYRLWGGGERAGEGLAARVAVTGPQGVRLG